MKRSLPLVLGAIAVVALVTWALMRQAPSSGGLQPPAPPTATTVTQEPELIGVPRTQLADAKKEIDAGSVHVIDVRDAQAYIASHIPGALQIPLARIEGEVNYLPRDKPILTYCT